MHAHHRESQDLDTLISLYAEADTALAAAVRAEEGLEAATNRKDAAQRQAALGNTTAAVLRKLHHADGKGADGGDTGGNPSLRQTTFEPPSALTLIA
eukprot:COSAG05_NODE_147_length_16383_cov_266.102555_7_plen_97_part_00